MHNVTMPQHIVNNCHLKSYFICAGLHMYYCMHACVCMHACLYSLFLHYCSSYMCVGNSFMKSLYLIGILCICILTTTQFSGIFIFWNNRRQLILALRYDSSISMAQVSMAGMHLPIISHVLGLSCLMFEPFKTSSCNASKEFTIFWSL